MQNNGKPAPLTPEERRRLLFAPITVGILAEQRVAAAKSFGVGGRPSPCLDRHQRQTGVRFMKDSARVDWSN